MGWGGKESFCSNLLALLKMFSSVLARGFVPFATLRVHLVMSESGTHEFSGSTNVTFCTIGGTEN